MVTRVHRSTNNREATLRLTRPLRRDLSALTKRVRQLERAMAKRARKA